MPGSLCLDAGRGQQLRVRTGRATSGATKTKRPKGIPPKPRTGWALQPGLRRTTASQELSRAKRVEKNTIKDLGQRRHQDLQ